jgi:hypothetical protein
MHDGHLPPLMFNTLQHIPENAGLKLFKQFSSPVIMFWMQCAPITRKYFRSRAEAALCRSSWHQISLDTRVRVSIVALYYVIFNIIKRQDR